MKVTTIPKISVKTETILFIIILLSGIFLRLWRLDSLPNGLDGDVAVTAGNSLHIFNRTEYKAFQINQIVGGPVAYLFWSMPLGSLLIAVFMKLFGQIEYGALFSGVFVGILSIPLVYLLAKRLTNVTIALLATYFFAFSPIHLVYSRSGYTHITLIVTLVTAAAYLLYKAVQTQNIRLIYLCGIVWGLILFNSYPIAYVVAPISVVYLAWARKTEWLFSKEFILSIFLAGAVFMLLAVGFAYINGSSDLLIVLRESYYQWVAVRLNETRANTTISDNILGGLKMLFLGSVPGYQFGILKIFGHSVLDPITKLTFIAGLLMSIVRRNLADKLLVLWVVFGFLITSVINIPQERYLFVLLPAPYILSASFIYFFFKVGLENRFRLLRVSTVILISGLLLAFAYGITYQQYFVSYANNNANMIHGLGDGDVADYLVENHDPKSTLVITSMLLPGVESITRYQYKNSIIWSEFLSKVGQLASDFSAKDPNPPLYPDHTVVNVNDNKVDTFWYGITPSTIYLSAKATQNVTSIVTFFSTVNVGRGSLGYSIESLGTNSGQWDTTTKKEDKNGINSSSSMNLKLPTNQIRLNLLGTVAGDALQKVEEVMIFSNPEKSLYIPAGVTDVVLILALNPNFKFYGNYDDLAKMMYRQADALFGGIDSKLKKTILGNNSEEIYRIYSLKVSDIQL
jgi:4-amino-4-deoxy-L-arabinose transferase-like glycosyltransferase